MDNRDQQELRGLLRDVGMLSRGRRTVIVQPADAIESGFVKMFAQELILPGEAGSVGDATGVISAINATGFPVWDGAEVYTDEAGEFIIASNSAHVIVGVWDGVGSKTSVLAYDFSDDGDPDDSAGEPAVGSHYKDTGVTGDTFAIVDPCSLLDPIASGDAVIFGVGDGVLTVIGPGAGEGGGGSGGGFDWPGPGTDPVPGTATVSICKAVVSQAGGVNSGDATFDFSGATAIIGTAPAGGTGTAGNTFLKAHCEGEDILIISSNAAGWATMKAHVNIIIAKVNKSGDVAASDATFPFDTAVAVEGAAPPAGTGTTNNVAALRWSNNETFCAVQQDDGDWLPFKIPFLNVITAKVNNSGGVRPADSTFGFDDAVAITGTAPSGGTGTGNNTYTETYADNEVVTLIQRADNLQWEALKKGDSFLVLKGSPSGAITRSSSTITCTSPTQVHGKVPVGSITIANSPELKCGTGDTIYFVFDLTAGSTNATRWTTAHPKNHVFILRGYAGYVEATGEIQALIHNDAGAMSWLGGTICNPAP